jgi:hypothetical protein
MPTRKYDAAELDPALKAAAWKAIKAMWDDYHGADGLHAKAQELHAAVEKSSERLMQLAHMAAQLSKHRGVQIGQYRLATEAAEERLKQVHDITNLKDPERGLNSWAVQKSNILRGMKLGVPVLEYKTEYEYRKAVQAKAMAQLPPPVPVPQIGRTKDGDLKLSDLQELFATTGIHSALVGPFAKMVHDAEQAKRPQLKAVEKLFQETMERLYTILR